MFETISRCHDNIEMSEKKYLNSWKSFIFIFKNLLEIKNSEEDQALYPPLLPSKIDLRQVTIIPHNEWKRIQDSLDSLTRKAACLRAERKAKKEMHFRSQEMVKHWTNTYAVSINHRGVHMHWRLTLFS